MCGIICEICNPNCVKTTDPSVLQRIKNRGPDYTKTIQLNVDETSITLSGSVLWMQGSQLTAQPVENEKGVLLYNGDNFDEHWNSEKSDTEQIMEKISKAAMKSIENVIEELKCFKGPFSIIYYNKETCNLLFARDKIGRNSLLFHKSDKSIVISSVLGQNYECVEIPASHIYLLNVKTSRLTLYSFQYNSAFDGEIEIDDWVNSIKSQQDMPDEEFLFNKNVNWSLNDKDNIVNLMEAMANKFANKLVLLQNLINNPVVNQISSEILQKLESSVAIRLLRQPKRCKNCLDSKTICSHSSVGILFSGGLDCTILAFLADKYVNKDQSIDLLNVAFNKDGSNATYEVPDRLTGRQSLEELKKVCPQRRWIFHEINVSRDELLKYQEAIMTDLVFPRRTVLDESLGTALWFAAKGEKDNVESPCRVLLLGSGADELFGGYTRHRKAFKQSGWIGLSNELMLDWKRISFRNLARDNRVICDHGRQPRMPYLDEDFTDFVLSLEPWFKCFPSTSMGPGVGDKLFLRLVAYQLGLENAAILPKRALQFGSRIANRKEKGSDMSKTFVIKN